MDLTVPTVRNLVRTTWDYAGKELSTLPYRRKLLKVNLVQLNKYKEGSLVQATEVDPNFRNYGIYWKDVG